MGEGGLWTLEDDGGFGRYRRGDSYYYALWEQPERHLVKHPRCSPAAPDAGGGMSGLVHPHLPAAEMMLKPRKPWKKQK